MKIVERLLLKRKVGTTSYIFSDQQTEKESYEYNIRLLGPHVNSIQLLLLGRDFLEIWEDKSWLSFVANLGKSYGLDFVVHLPLDFHLWSETNEKHFLQLSKLLRNLSVLHPCAYVMHLEKSDGMKTEPYTPRQKDKMTFQSFLQKLSSIGEYPILFENTHYDLSFFSQKMRNSPFGVCFDVEHWWLLKRNEREFVSSFGSKIRLFHLHGVKENKDHLSLAVLSESKIRDLLFLIGQKPLIIEVFSIADLISSLVVLKQGEQGGEW